jgi:hypothetical protein
MISQLQGAVSSFLRREKTLSYLRNPHFINLEGSLPCSRQPRSGPYYEPDAALSLPTYFNPISNIPPVSSKRRLLCRFSE